MPLTAEQYERTYNAIQTGNAIIEKRQDGKNWITISIEITQETTFDWLIAEGMAFLGAGKYASPLSVFLSIMSPTKMGTAILPKDDFILKPQDKITMRGDALIKQLFPTTLIAPSSKTPITALVTPPAAKPVVAKPVITPPPAKPVAKPVVAKPVITPPPAKPVAKPVVAKPVVTPPPAAKPVAKPAVAKPVITPPPAAKPVAKLTVAKPVVTPPPAKPVQHSQKKLNTIIQNRNLAQQEQQLRFLREQLDKDRKADEKRRADSMASVQKAARDAMEASRRITEQRKREADAKMKAQVTSFKTVYQPIINQAKREAANGGRPSNIGMFSNSRPTIGSHYVGSTYKNGVATPRCAAPSGNSLREVPCTSSIMRSNRK